MQVQYVHCNSEARVLATIVAALI